jgi:predicted nucleotidyltransferase
MLTGMAKALGEYRFLRQLADLPFVQAVWLHGSRARGTARERSDIDLAILCPGATVADWARMLDIIEEADTLLSIDAVRFDELGAGDPLRAAILRDRQVLFERVPVD